MRAQHAFAFEPAAQRDPLRRLVVGAAADLEPCETASANAQPASTTLRGGSGDVLAGHGGHDRLMGGPGPDLLLGGLGRDWLLGGAGAAKLVDTSGPTVARTGAGEDYVYVRDGRSDDVVTCGSRGATVLADRGDRVQGPPYRGREARPGRPPRPRALSR